MEPIGRVPGAALTLHDLEFPPPPMDLPPPPESPRRLSGTPPPPPKPSPSPRTKRRVGPEFANKENLPERLGRASRRHREASSDSCESGRSFEAAAAFQAVPKSPVSPLSENRTLGSPAVGSLSSPGSGGDAPAAAHSSDAIRPYKKSDMELKLLNEIRERADVKKSPVKEAPPGRGATAASATASAGSSSPAAMLVSELFESIKAKNHKVGIPEKVVEAAVPVEIDFKANLRKVSKTVSDDSAEKLSKSSVQQIDFKSQLKKKSDSKPELDQKEASDDAEKLVDFKSKLRKSKPDPAQLQQQPEATEPLDLKARLRKVSDGKPAADARCHDHEDEDERPVIDGPSPQDGLDKRDSLGSLEEGEKRKSTGSISSLRKMWESSPKIGGRKSEAPAAAEEPHQDLSPDTPGNASSVKFEKRVWPPVPNTEMEKPMVPVKPTVKPPAPTTKPPPPKDPSKVSAKPAMAVKPNVCNIYAAPSASTVKPRPPLPSSKPRNGEPAAAHDDPDRDSLLVTSQKLDTSLDAAKRDSAGLSKHDLSSLSDEIGSFHSSASGFIDSVPPTTRFRFRSLLTKLDQQSKEFSANVTSSSSSTSSVSSSASTRLAGDIQVTLRDLATVLQR
jgi:abelson tyrosine-protein kinase 1